MTPRRPDHETLTAADLMTRDVMTLDPSLPVARALARLGELEVSGAPVVDAAGHVIGVFSARDATRNLADAPLDAVMPAPRMDEDDEELVPVEVLESELGDHGACVADWMSTELAWVPPTADLRAVCKKFVESGVHRLFVLDRRRLVGIVSTMDVVRRFAD
jgi:CBS domain-containing protein